MKHKLKYRILLAIFIIAFLSSFLLSQGIGCDTSCTLSESKILDKTTNGYIGSVIFAFLSIITYLNISKPNKKREKIINFGIIIGSMIAIYFLYLQFFVLKAYCKYCLIIDFGLLITLGIILFDSK